MRVAVFLIGVLTGSAVDSQRHPVPSAKVTVQRVGAKDAVTVVTDSAGVYRVSVSGGTYTVRAESAGQGEASAGPFTVAENKVTTVDLVLQPQYFDEPRFTVAGVTDNTYRGGHGSDTVLRSAEALTKKTAALSKADGAGEREERAGQPLKAVQEYQRAAELDPSEPNLFEWGTELLAHRAPEAAAEVFGKGVRLFPQSVRMLLGFGSACYAAGSYERAADLFFKAADVHPDDPQPYLFLSEVQRREITQLPGYEERLARFARLEPENALANYYYAICVWQRGDAAKTTALLERAVRLDQRLGPAYLQLGIVYAAGEKYAEAIRAYRRAVEVSPELEEAHYRLSEAYRATGNQTKAQEELAVYQRLSKESAEKVERERREVRQFVVALRAQ